MQSKMPSNVFWDWSPDIWGWMPDRQRWAPDHGLPREPAYMEVSTDPAPPREAYDSGEKLFGMASMETSALKDPISRASACRTER